MKKINTLKKEKEVLAMNYEQEEEFLTNDLSKKLLQVLHVIPNYYCYFFYFFYLLNSATCLKVRNLCSVPINYLMKFLNFDVHSA